MIPKTYEQLEKLWKGREKELAALSAKQAMARRKSGNESVPPLELSDEEWIAQEQSYAAGLSNLRAAMRKRKRNEAMAAYAQDHPGADMRTLGDILRAKFGDLFGKAIASDDDLAVKCWTCLDSGQITLNRDGDVQIVRCPECRPENQEERFARLLRWGGFDMRIYRCTFAGYNVAWDGLGNMTAAYEAAVRFATEDSPQILVLAGNIGCGKTHLALAIAGAYLARGQTAYFVHVPRWLDDLRTAMRHNDTIYLDDLTQRPVEADLLVIDDLGKEKATDWAMEKLYLLVDQRYSSGLRLVVTTNSRLEELDAAMRSRLWDTHQGVVIGCNGADYRLRKELLR